MAGVARWARWLLCADAAASAAALVLAWRRGFDPYAVGEGEALFLLAEFVLILVTAIVFFVWIYRANANARALGAEDMMVTPGWAVGWFFVPLANLVMPFIAVRELWKASGNPKDWQLAPAPLAIPLWWGFWLASNVTGGISVSLSLQGNMEAVTAAETVTAISELLSIPAALLMAWIINGVEALQASPAHLKDRFA